MMNYEIFKEVVKEKFMDYMPDSFKGMELIVRPAEKVNMTYDAINIRGEDTTISPTIYINDMYEKYQSCGDLEETLMAACDLMAMEFAKTPQVVDVDLSDVTISKKLIAEENDHAVKTRVPGTWGKDVRYVWLHKENVMDIHNGKTMLTFLDTSKDYKLYDEQNRVVTTKKGDELYTHYDKVESSVRERYEKVQKEQKKTTKKKTVTTRKER